MANELDFDKVNIEAEKWAAADNPQDKESHYKAIITELYMYIQKVFRPSGYSEEEDKKPGKAYDSDVRIFLGVSCSYDDVTDTLSYVLGDGCTVPENAYDPRKGTLFTTYFISILEYKAKDRNRKKAVEAARNSGAAGLTSFSFEKLGIPVNSVITWEERPEMEIRVAKGNNVVITDTRNSVTNTLHFGELLKLSIHTELYKKLKSFFFGGKTLYDLWYSQKKTPYLGSGYKLYKHTDDDGNTFCEPYKDEELYEDAGDSGILALALFVKSILDSKKNKKHIDGVYSYCMINFTRKFLDIFFALNNYAYELLTPMDMGFVRTVTTYSVGDFIAFCNSDYSNYVFENDLLFNDFRLKEKALNMYYNISQSTMNDHIQSFMKISREILKK